MAQSASAEDYFAEARKEAFNNKHYPQAIRLCDQALAINPAYDEIALFKGRLFLWQQDADSARKIFREVLAKNTLNKESLIALTDLERALSRPSAALLICDSALQLFPGAIDLQNKKASILHELERDQEAAVINNKVLVIDEMNQDATRLRHELRDSRARNQLGVDYQFTHYDKQFTGPWHLLSIGYSSKIKGSTISGILHYANRFGKNGLQLEAEGYQPLSRKIYFYAAAAYSPDNIFPSYRGALSVYATLPKGLEAEVGCRYLHFNEGTLIYTVSAAKSFQKFWFNARTFVTPRIGSLSTSYSLMSRYYLKSAEDFVFLAIGKGVSPDDNSNNLRYNKAKEQLSSLNASAGLHHSLGGMRIVSLSAGWIKDEYLPGTYGHQLSLGAGLQQKF